VAPTPQVHADWPQFLHDPAHTGYNAAEALLSSTSVRGLKLAWRTTSVIDSSPAVADGVVYVTNQGDDAGALSAFAVGCSTGGGICTPLWTATIGDVTDSSPAVADGVVYVTSIGDDGGGLSAFKVGCNTGGGSCTPLWTATTGDIIDFSPTVADGVVYVAGTIEGKLYAFAVGCASDGGSCSPLWTGSFGTANSSPEPSHSSPALADGVVYIAGAYDSTLYAFRVDCADGGSCTPFWRGTIGGRPPHGAAGSSPAVADGVVYVTSAPYQADGAPPVVARVYAFRADCADGGRFCTPIWTATVGHYSPSPPVIANGVVYVGSGDGELYAFKVRCADSGRTCSPFWTGTAANLYGGGPPVVANGVVYVGTCASHCGWPADGKLQAYAVGCASGGRSCGPLWTGAIRGIFPSTPVVADGVVYIGSASGKLHAFALNGGVPSP
jgi:outer membrane protein assembly factor BamB